MSTKLFIILFSIFSISVSQTTGKISGIITDHNGSVVTDFNGNIFPTVYDKESTIETLQNDSGSEKAGTCPVCGMDYVKLDEHTKDGHKH